MKNFLCGIILKVALVGVVVVPIVVANPSVAQETTGTEVGGGTPTVLEFRADLRAAANWALGFAAKYPMVISLSDANAMHALANDDGCISVELVPQAWRTDVHPALPVDIGRDETNMILYVSTKPLKPVKANLLTYYANLVHELYALVTHKDKDFADTLKIYIQARVDYLKNIQALNYKLSEFEKNSITYFDTIDQYYKNSRQRILTLKQGEHAKNCLSWRGFDSKTTTKSKRSKYVNDIHIASREDCFLIRGQIFGLISESSRSFQDGLRLVHLNVQTSHNEIFDLIRTFEAGNPYTVPLSQFATQMNSFVHSFEVDSNGGATFENSLSIKQCGSRQYDSDFVYCIFQALEDGAPLFGSLEILLPDARQNVLKGILDARKMLLEIETNIQGQNVALD